MGNWQLQNSAKACNAHSLSFSFLLLPSFFLKLAWYANLHNCPFLRKCCGLPLTAKIYTPESSFARTINQSNHFLMKSVVLHHSSSAMRSPIWLTDSRAVGLSILQCMNCEILICLCAVLVPSKVLINTTFNLSNITCFLRKALYPLHALQQRKRTMRKIFYMAFGALQMLLLRLRASQHQEHYTWILYWYILCVTR